MTGLFLLKGDFLKSASQNSFEITLNGTAVLQNGVLCGIYGPGKALPENTKGAEILDYSGKLIIPGFTDLHIHAPQYAFRGLGTDMELLEWLKTNAFPEEARFAETAYAEKAYTLFADELKHSGTTRAVIFGTKHTDATLLLMRKMEESGLLSFVGKVNMDRNCPDSIREASAEESLKETERFLSEARRLSFRHTRPVLTPRFIPSCTDRLMEGLGQIAKRDGLPVQSHLSENPSEIEWVRELCPESSSYLNAYDRAGVLNPGGKTVMAHCVWCPEEEIRLLSQKEIYVAHCPASNTNIASGIAPIRRYLEEGLKVGLGTDVAGGHTKSVLDTIKEAIQVSKLSWRYLDSKRKPLTVKEAFYLATEGGSRFFDGASGFETGKPLHALVLDESQLKTTRENLRPEERLERFVYLGDDRDILHKFAEGEQLY